MKFIVFNLIVAGALVYLVAGDNIRTQFTDAATTTAEAETVETAKAAQADTVARLKPEVEQISKTVARRAARQLIEENRTVETEKPLQETDVATVETHLPPQPEATATPAPVQLKDGPPMMSARERSRQLDAIAQSMEMIYLDKAGH